MASGSRLKSPASKRASLASSGQGGYEPRHGVYRKGEHSAVSLIKNATIVVLFVLSLQILGFSLSCHVLGQAFQGTHRPKESRMCQLGLHKSRGPRGLLKAGGAPSLRSDQASPFPTFSGAKSFLLKAPVLRAISL